MGGGGGFFCCCKFLLEIVNANENVLPVVELLEMDAALPNQRHLLFFCRVGVVEVFIIEKPPLQSFDCMRRQISVASPCLAVLELLPLDRLGYKWCDKFALVYERSRSRQLDSNHRRLGHSNRAFCRLLTRRQLRPHLRYCFSNGRRAGRRRGRRTYVRRTWILHRPVICGVARIEVTVVSTTNRFIGQLDGAMVAGIR